MSDADVSATKLPPAGESSAAVAQAAPVKSRFQQISSLVIRPLVLAFVFSVLVFAVIQATGRLVMAGLHIFEPDFNVLLAEQNIRVSEMRGGWRGFNPVLRIEAVAAPMFQAADVYFELDLLESIWHNDLVAHRLTISAIELHADRHEAGWRLRGLGEEEGFDASTFLRHSDVLEANAELKLHDLLNPTAAIPWLRAEVSLRNAGGVRRLWTSVTSSAGLDGQSLIINGQDIALDRLRTQYSRNLAVRGGVYLPEVLTNGLAVRVEHLRLNWQQTPERGRGDIAVLAQLDTSYTESPIELQVAGDLGALGSEYVLALDPLARVQASELQLDTVFLRVDGEQVGGQTEDELFTRLVAGTPDKPMTALWLRQLDLADVTSFVKSHFASWEPAGRWIRELDLRGQADNLHAFVDRDGRMGYAASVSDLHMQGYKGAPTLARGQGVVWGHTKAVALRLNAQDVDLQFPDLYHNGWHLDYITGVVKGVFGQGYFALRGEGLKTQIGDSAIAGEFSLTRPDPRYEQRVGLMLNLDQSSLQQARQFVPYKIPQDLQNWLQSGPRSGHMTESRFAYQGQVHTRPNELGRRIELKSKVHDATVQYEASWPLVEGFAGDVHVAGEETRVIATAGTSLQLDLAGSRVALKENGRYAQGILNVRGAGQHVLQFVRGSPLQDTLSFVTPDWTLSGQLQAQGPMTVPLREDAPALALGFDFQISDADLHMPDYRSTLTGLAGAGRFDLPHNLTGIFRGKMFDQPAQFVASHDTHQINFDITGSATPEDVYALIAYEDSVPVYGQFDFSGRLSLPMLVDHLSTGIPSLQATSDLVGLQVDLPAEFGKRADVVAPAELDVQFLEEYQAVRWEYGATHGWLHYAEELQRGAVGINAKPPMTTADTQAIVISGSMPRVVLSDWVSDQGESSVALPLDWDIRGLAVGEFVIDELTFAELNLSGSQVGEDVWFSFDGDDLAGSVELPDGERMRIALGRLRVPASELAAETADAADQPVEFLVSVEVGESLPEAEVSIENLFIDQEPFGSWRFNIEPKLDPASGLNQAVAFTNFATDVNGVHIEGADLHWELQDNVSAFDGQMQLDDLQSTLPLWDFPAAMATSQASLIVQGSWRGSPLDIRLLGLNGELAFRAKDGRFLEVDAGAGGLRMLSLVNFSKAAKRFSFDFSDVVGEGISFDSLSARVALDDGQLRFVDRMRLSGSSGAYQLGGQVDLHQGTLDNEMIVTLPVSNSLPWYGVYLALANPLAGLGVVVGERVLRKPLQQFSSAKFSVTGTLDEPQINFVSLWDQSMKESELQDAAVNEPDVIDDTLTSQEELESRDVEVLDQSS